jgi:AcrR family transcriptional regulator
MTTTDAVTPRLPGRPRSARADEAIIEAVLSLLQDGTPVDALSIEAVAAKAGVGKATIYRRWANKDALVLDAIRALKGGAPKPAGVSVREDLVALLAAMLRPNDNRALKILPCLVPEVLRNPEQHRLYQEIIEPRREIMREVLRRGVHTGELRADVDIELAIDMLAGPIIYRFLITGGDLEPAAAKAPQLLETLLEGLSPRRPGR